eukprot:PhM_4_TR13950/c2_g4_i1/m.32210
MKFGILFSALVLSVVVVVAFASAAAEAAAPDAFILTFNTDVKSSSSSNSSIAFLINRTWAPLGVDHLHEVASSGFFTEAAFFRYVPNFVLQFGIAGTPSMNTRWATPIKDDPFVGHSNKPGTLVYAKTHAANSRTTQLFINFVHNSFLDSQKFVPLGTIIYGMDVAKAAMNPTPTSSHGIDQWNYKSKGNAWIKKEFPHVNFVKDVTIEKVQN